MGVINNAAKQPLFAKSGTVPDVSGALQDYYQPMIFINVGKIVAGFQVLESAPQPINFRGVIEPFTARQLELKPEGQRSWTWLTLHSDTTLILNTDDIVNYLGKQTRVMKLYDNSLYGFMRYELVQDWEGSGP